MESPVYFIDMRATFKENFHRKLENLLEAVGIEQVIEPKDLVALKIHFGEMGNTGYVRPAHLRKIVEIVKKHRGSPFLTDANTLYAGTRSDAPSHMVTAIRNGFAFSVVDAPLVIADGLRGKSETAVPIGQKRFEEVYIGTEIVEADALISVAHFKGHELSGFGGTMKNLGMGCASRKGKLAQHSTVSPQVKTKRCVGCGTCAEHCSQGAITVTNGKAEINPETCIGCGECIILCTTGAVQIQWNQSVPVFQENLAEYTMGVLKGKSGKSLFLNFITDVTPACDCLPVSDAPIVRDLGVVASTDPIAIDQASVDLVNAEPALAGCALEKNRLPGEDKFRGLYPLVDWETQLQYGEQLGLGTRCYRLEKI